jgi:hypothetical protein
MNSVLVDSKARTLFSKSSSYFPNFINFGLHLVPKNTRKKLYPQFGRKLALIICGPILFLHNSPAHIK